MNTTDRRWQRCCAKSKIQVTVEKLNCYHVCESNRVRALRVTRRNKVTKVEYRLLLFVFAEAVFYAIFSKKHSQQCFVESNFATTISLLYNYKLLACNGNCRPNITVSPNWFNLNFIKRKEPVRVETRDALYRRREAENASLFLRPQSCGFNSF